MTEEKAAAWARKNVWPIRSWLAKHTHRDDGVGLHARTILRHRREDDPPADRGDDAAAAREYEEAREASIARATAPMPENLAALLRGSYLNPGDVGQHAAVADWLHEHPGSTPVGESKPWRWLCVRAFWEAIGFRVSHGWRYPASWGSNDLLDWDHFGRTVVHRLEAFVTEPYGAFTRGLDSVTRIAPLVDAIVFAAQEADHNASCYRVGFLPPNELIAPAERRAHGPPLDEP